MEPSEVQAILSQANLEPLGALYILALSTGMRIGELLGLEWNHVDLETGTLEIKQTEFRGTINAPKTKRSRRKIKLPRIAIDALQHHPSKASLYVFPGRSGVLHYQNFLKNRYYHFIRSAGVPYRKFHSFRHYAASQLILSGVPITAVARYLGDTKTSILNTYSHLIYGKEDLAPTAMDLALGYTTDKLY